MHKTPSQLLRHFFCAIAVAFGMIQGAAASESAQLRVLFLGDNDIHKPIERHKILAPVLAENRIELIYTDDVRDINASKLAGFDALLIYANITKIAPEQETAILEFVQAGGGLVPIHCASYCFHNSPKYIDLVGAQFKSHGSGIFSETIVKTKKSTLFIHNATISQYFNQLFQVDESISFGHPLKIFCKSF